MSPSGAAVDYLHLTALMSQVGSASNLRGVYQSTFDCLRRALDVNRAAVLLFDAQGVMRFVEWVGLSEDYRNRVEGHSPWRGDEGVFESIAVPDVSQDESLLGYKELFKRESIGALAFIPLVFAGRLLGKFMLYSDQPRTFESQELGFAQTVADYIAFALERRWAEERLQHEIRSEQEARNKERQSETRLRLALRAGEMGTWEWNVKTGSVNWSAELEEIHGLQPGTFQGTFDAFRADAHPDDSARVLEAAERTVRQKCPEYQVEYRIIRPDGEQRWVFAQGKLMLDEAGEPECLLGVCSDVTRRHMAQQWQDFLADAGQVLASSLDPALTLTSLAHLAVRDVADWCAIHVPRDSGQLTLLDIAHAIAHADSVKVKEARAAAKDWPQAERNVLLSVLQSGAPQLLKDVGLDLLENSTLGASDAQEPKRPGLHSALVLPLQVRGDTVGVMTLVAAHSKRKYTEEDLGRAMEFANRTAAAYDCALLFQSAQEAQASAEHAMRQVQVLLDASDALAASLDPQLTLSQFAEFLATRMADYAIVYSLEDDQVTVSGAAHRSAEKAGLVRQLARLNPPSIADDHGVGFVIRTGETVLAAHLDDAWLAQNVTGEAQLKIVRELEPRSMIIVPMQSRGKMLGAVAVSSAAPSEVEYGTSDLRLLQELADRAALLLDNANLYHRAKAALAARDNVLAMVSHDLRNPLNTISTACQLLEMELTPARRKKAHDVLRRSSEQMTRLVQDLMDVSLLDAGTLRLEPHELDPCSLLQDTMSMFRPLAAYRQIGLQLEVAEGAPKIVADRLRLSQVLSNLLGNALKHSPAGGTITVRLRQQEAAVHFEVSDTGLGIPKEDQQHVFKRFWKAPNQTEKGFGLGLAIAKGIIDAHAGKIGLTSEPGAGSTFFFEVPLRPEGDGANPASSESQIRPAVPASVLRAAVSRATQYAQRKK